MNHHSIIALLLWIGFLPNEIEAFISFNNQTNFDVFDEDFHYTENFDYNRFKRSVKDKSKGLRYGIELKCDRDKECHDWVNQRHFCVIGRCIQLFCENHQDCPSKSRCYDGLCIVVTSCKHTEDCQDGLVCLDGKCSPDEDDSKECDVGCECQDDKDCVPVRIDLFKFGSGI